MGSPIAPSDLTLNHLEKIKFKANGIGKSYNFMGVYLYTKGRI